MSTQFRKLDVHARDVQDTLFQKIHLVKKKGKSSLGANLRSVVTTTTCRYDVNVENEIHISGIHRPAFQQYPETFHLHSCVTCTTPIKSEISNTFAEFSKTFNKIQSKTKLIFITFTKVSLRPSSKWLNNNRHVITSTYKIGGLVKI